MPVQERTLDLAVRTFEPGPLLAGLERGLERELSRLPAAAIPGLLSIALPLPAGLVPLPAGLEGGFMARPAEDLHLLGHGTAAVVETGGPDRFAELSRALGGLSGTWHHRDPGGTGLEPLAFAAFAFDHGGSLVVPNGLPNAVLRVPLLLIRRERGRVAAIFSTRRDGKPSPGTTLRAWMEAATAVLQALAAGPGRMAPAGPLRRIVARPADSVWLGRVERAIKAIRAGEVDKVVLSRRVRIAAEGALDPSRAVARLAARCPEWTVFSFAGGAGTTVGATPERLLSLTRGRVESDALAGTESGRSPGSAQFPGAPLLSNPKTLREHSLVVDAVARALEPLCTELDVPSRPRLLRLPDLQHLWSLVTGQVRPGIGLFDLAARLHPTPAVATAPDSENLEWLRRLGERRLGWYTGGIGWVGRDGDGGLSVVLRCAALDAQGAELSAGAGIVAASRPERELEETELKLAAMLDALRDG